MRKDFQEILSNIRDHMQEQINSARTARAEGISHQQDIMLTGKIKAYVEARCWIVQKYGHHMLPDGWKDQYSNNEK